MDRVREAYRIVLNDILNNDCGMFIGEYDAKNGSAEFMNGIGTVMEYLAYLVSDEYGAKFEDIFLKNLIKSEERA